MRISGDEYTDGGLTLNNMIYVSRRLEKAGVDMISVSGGTTIKRGSAIPAAGTKQASHAALSREIKKHVGIPVATVGRINEAWIAEELIKDGARHVHDGPRQPVRCRVLQQGRRRPRPGGPPPASAACAA